jgi:RimJ/RimL family protein N-acetyltransferase
MKKYPVIHTERLLLRGFKTSDTNDIKNLAGDFEIADTTLNVPHPYEEGMAQKWLSELHKDFEEGKGIFFAITLVTDGQLIGTIGLKGINHKHSHAELGYWIGKNYWNKGYATEAAIAVIKYGLSTMNLHRIFAFHYTRNPASGKVLEKAGMKYEGTMKSHIRKWDKYEDIAFYGIVKF